MRGALGVWGEVGRVVAGGTLNGLSDGELLRRFGRDRDEAAFEALVARLGPMVLGVCRRELRDRRDAEDAFQATFLVLARRAGGLRDADRVGAWVYGVSRKVSRKAKAVAVRRAGREKVGDGEAEAALGLATVSDADDPVGDLVREAVARLPSKFREPLQLCHLEGFSHAEAAEMLRSSPDAIRGRLERARALLRERLRRIGLGPRGAEDDRALNSKSKAVVPASLIGSTVRLALQSGPRAAGALALAREVLVTMMLWNVFNTASFILLGTGLVGTGLLAGEDPKDKGKVQGQKITVEALLKGWRDASKGWKTLDVRFEQTHEIPKLDHTEQRDGRLFLGPGDRSAMESVRRGDPKSASRMVWTGEAVHHFLGETRQHFLWTMSETDRGKLPAEMRLPFLWGLEPATLFGLYDITIAGENDRLILVAFKTRKVAVGDFETLFVEIDRSTFLPRKAHAVLPRRDINTFRFTSIQAGAKPPKDLTSTVTHEGWKMPRTALFDWMAAFIYRRGLLPK